MSSWPVVSLGEVATIERDGVQASAISGGMLYVGLENIASGGEFVDVREVSDGELASSKFRFTASHLLYGKLRPYLGKIARPDFAGICSTDILPVLPGGALSRDYLSHFLRQQSVIDLATARSSGVNLPRLSPKVLATFEIPLPPLDEQRRIAAILDQAETLRAQRRAAIAQLDSLGQAIFVEMFGDPATHAERWRMGKIEDLLQSASYGTSQKAGPAGEYPVLRMGNISRTGEIDLSDLKYIDLAPNEAERYLVKAGDVLFNRTNSVDLVGKTAVFRGVTPMAYAGYLIRLRVNAENDPEYLARFLNTDFAKAKLRGMAKSIVGMANINAKEIQAMRIALPPFDLQRSFAHRIAAVEGIKVTHRRSLAEFDTLFASLQHRAFRGEL